VTVKVNSGTNREIKPTDGKLIIDNLVAGAAPTVNEVVVSSGFLPTEGNSLATRVTVSSITTSDGVTDTEGSIIGTVTWDPADKSAKKDVAYTATVTLTPPATHDYNTSKKPTVRIGSVTIKSGDVTVTEDGNLTFTYVYTGGKTARTITFADVTDGKVTKTFGDSAFTYAATRSLGTDTITYTSDNLSVATVDDTGKVTIIGAGTANITASVAATGEYTNASGTYQLTVNPKKAINTPTIITTSTPGTKLSDIRVDTTTMVPNSGTVTWTKDGSPAAASDEVVKGATYTWTYTPTDKNYGPTSGNIVLYPASASTYSAPSSTTTNFGSGSFIVGSGGGSSGSGSTGTASTGIPTTGNTAAVTSRTTNGATVTTVTDQRTGTVTETTVNTDGTTVRTETHTDGSAVTVATQATGEVATTNKTSDGTVGTTVVNSVGQVTSATANVSIAAVSASAQSGQSVTLPVAIAEAYSTASAPTVDITIPQGYGSVKVEIPVSDVTPGTVAVLVSPTGVESIIRSTVVTDSGVRIALTSDSTVKIIDNSKSFNDVSGTNWASDAVAFVSSHELFNGTSATTFSPDADTTRAQLMTVLARYAGADTSGDALAQGMAWAKAQGISDGSNPDGRITREQLATMLWRFAGSPSSSQNLTNADAGEVSDYAARAMAWAVESGIIQGNNGLLDPTGSATRAQVATMVMRFNSLMSAQ
jgi:hypothetical protein